MATDSVILVTGFEPFGADNVNPSGEIAKTLDGRWFGTASVQSLILPVQHEAARARMAAALGDLAPAAIVHLGLAGGRARIALEQVGVNVMDYRIPDAHGDVISGEPCVPNGPAAFFASLPLREILSALTAEGIPAYLSYSAGTYLCNYVLYTTLHVVAERGMATRAGFVHVPFLPSMVTAHGLDEPSMDLPLMVRAVETVLRTIATP